MGKYLLVESKSLSIDLQVIPNKKIHNSKEKIILEIYDNLRYTDIEGQKSILFCPFFFY